MEWHVHCPARTRSSPAPYVWRCPRSGPGGHGARVEPVASFTIEDGARRFVLPLREELARTRALGAPPALPATRAPGTTSGSARRGPSRQSCARRPAGLRAASSRSRRRRAEPPTYPAGVKRGSERWREIWWGNRRYTIQVLESRRDAGVRVAARRKRGVRARSRSGCCSTRRSGIREARPATATTTRRGCPTPTTSPAPTRFVAPSASPSRSARLCRTGDARSADARCTEHLCPRHLWRPYSSHANRAWHFLGEVGIAFLGEIPEAADWLWFAVNVFANVYPVWCDDDGGWHEGVNYWSSYLGRFTWWGDVMKQRARPRRLPPARTSRRSATTPMYLMPPGHAWAADSAT